MLLSFQYDFRCAILYINVALQEKKKNSEETLKGEQLLANLPIDFQFQYLFLHCSCVGGFQFCNLISISDADLLFPTN